MTYCDTCKAYTPKGETHVRYKDCAPHPAPGQPLPPRAVVLAAIRAQERDRLLAHIQHSR